MRLSRVLLTLVILLGVLAYTTPAQASHILVMALPFSMGEETPADLRRTAMETIAAGLDSEGAEITGLDVIKELVLKDGVDGFDEAAAYGLKKRVRADFALIGSMTTGEQETTVEVRLLDLEAEEPFALFTIKAASRAELARKSRETAAKLFGRMTERMRSRPVLKAGLLDMVSVYGNVRVDDEAVLRKLSSRPGEPFSQDDVRDDIRTIYGMGYFDDVYADLTDTASGKALVFHVRELPYIKGIEVRGNDEIKTDRINAVITLKENTALDRAVLGENVEKIKSLYAEEGFYLAKITPVIESEGADALVIFQIDEGDEVRVKRITFIGNKAFSGRQLKKGLNTKEVWFLSWLTQAGKFHELAFQSDLGIILGKYFDNGYIQAEILDHRVLLSEDKRWFYVTVAVSEGEQFRVGEVDASGEFLDTREEILEKIETAPGEVFKRSTLSGDIDTIMEMYGDKGYAYADVTPLTDIDPEKKTLDVTFDIKKNELVYVERIDITGNLSTRDKVIRREMELGEGELFSSSKLKRSRNNLRRLGFFDDVNIRRTRGSTESRIKLDVDVKERPTGSISVGMGYSSVDKLMATASISKANFMGKGIQLDISGTVSASSSKYIVGFTEPWLFDKPLSAGFDIYRTEREYPDFSIRKNGFDIKFGFPIMERYTRGYVTYKLEDVNIYDVASNASSVIKDQEGTSTESSITTTIKRDTRNDFFFPTEGSVLAGSAEVAGGPLGGTSYYAKFGGDAVKFFPLFKQSAVSVRASLGHVTGYDDREAPVYEKYYLGGINTIRGFRTRSVSPRDPVTGELIGGDTMMVLSAEMLFPLILAQQLRGVVFFDAGNSYKGPLDLGDIRKSYGAGIRWLSPIGPLRLELGVNLDPRDDEPKQQWDFTIGSAF